MEKKESLVRRRVAALSRVIRKEPIAFIALLVSVLSAYFSVLSRTEVWALPEIRALIAEEARACLEGNADRAASLYCVDALVRNWGGYDPDGPNPLESWQGRDQIRHRYANLPRFTRLMHVDVNVVEVSWFTGTARAVSSTDGTVVMGGPGDANSHAGADIFLRHVLTFFTGAATQDGSLSILDINAQCVLALLVGKHDLAEAADVGPQEFLAVLHPDHAGLV
jgi:hypothetical protein